MELKTRNQKALQLLNRYNLKSLITSIHAEKTVVNENEIEEYIRILLEQFKNVSASDQIKLKNIKNCSNQNQFEINYEDNEKFKIYFFRVARLSVEFEIEIYSYAHEFKLTSLAALWRQLFGDSADGFILSELNSLFECKNDLLIFLFQQACNLDFENGASSGNSNSLDYFSKKLLNN